MELRRFCKRIQNIKASSFPSLLSLLYLKLTLFFPLFKLQPQLQLLQSSSVHCILGILELNDLIKNSSKLVEKYL